MSPPTQVRTDGALSRAVAIAGFGLMLCAPVAAQSGLFSERFEFKDRVTLAPAAEAPGGLRLDSVRFELPAATDDRVLRTSGLVTAQVAVSNTAAKSRKVGLAIALHDPAGRLLAVASAGTKLTPLKPGRQKTYVLTFDDVNAEAHKAATFEITLETKP